jgi:hypothetical protein
LNADDLITGPRIIKVREVRLLSEDQPVGIYYDGDNGKPYKPCKSMRRVLVMLWGGDGSKYPGRSMRLYRDESVTFGAAKVGGIRISHMSDIDGEKVLSLTATKAQRKPFKVLPLRPGDAPKLPAADPDFDVAAFVTLATATATEATDADALKAWWDEPETVKSRKALAAADADKSATVRATVTDRIGELAAGGDV